MTTLIFDTHAFVKELTQAGMSEEQAEVLAQSQAALIAEKLATKQDLKELEVGLKRDIKELEVGLKRDMKEMEANLKRDMKEMETRLKQDSKKLERDIKELELRLKRDMQELKHDMTVRLGSMVVVAIGVVAALVKLL